ncbi:hypothetical protein CH251_12450 [Rhodococcus sp. 06-462-5]|nr:hypothetical protein CH251_12450 [Rhodococcus sp. 06-462-5]OZE67932.1 hypothetical protein CH270_09410 [Rhodococcus sp. 02-925g]OZF51061.1 hypothetical protein CH291_05570 [Rhodococcus sp. 14-1411-2a]
MTVSGSNTNKLNAVGDVVQVVRADGIVLAGTIVEDYADSLLAADDLGRDWARPHRWGVALDTGVLVFVDDADLVEGEAEPTGSSR